jgi:enoyl-[acyl-carrier-protein] reductase (NADH)
MNAPELKVYDMVSDGIAGNAKNYASSLKNASVEIQDKFLINKYRSDYETILINMDDLINNLMLKQTLTLDEKNPLRTIENLAKMQQAKSALNSVMKFIDSQ